jgi:hypothetical protein
MIEFDGHANIEGQPGIRALGSAAPDNGMSCRIAVAVACRVFEVQQDNFIALE